MVDQKENQIKRMFRRKGNSASETKILERILPKENRKEIYQKYLEIIEYKNRKKNNDNKIEIFKKILNSQFELENEKIRELKEKIDNLKEESLQREIETIERVLSSLREEKNSELLDWLKEEVNSLKERIIIRKTEKYLEAKKTYLDTRLEIAKKLDEYCKNLGENNTNYQERKVIIKGISDILGTLTLSIKPMGIGFNINLGKLGEVASDINDYWEINSQYKSGKEFEKYLESDENNTFKEIYNSLEKVLSKNKGLKISKMIISNLKLKVDTELDIEVLKTFKVRHEKICSIASN
ncbi:7497_t:CDS:1 [Diversispora eburnea]|uniref:7497_t:CDS:1 n=1 Tax=Diversispora eburnea TaxID=1213867 RepID=A0A9N9D1K0_9GLOM|nr:7497_t:CDS:1 [Diversispora eburnea]